MRAKITTHNELWKQFYTNTNFDDQQQCHGPTRLVHQQSPTIPQRISNFIVISADLKFRRYIRHQFQHDLRCKINFSVQNAWCFKKSLLSRMQLELKEGLCEWGIRHNSDADNFVFRFHIAIRSLFNGFISTQIQHLKINAMKARYI